MIDTLDLRQDHALAARTDNYRRDHHVQAVKAARGKKARYRIRAAFDQHPANAARS